MTTLRITYSITPPLSFTPGASPAPPPQTATFSYPLSTSSPVSHLESLELALGQARGQMNETLTEWKDALKGEESEKEKKKGKKAIEEDEEDEGEDED
ncbi:SPOSA6832_03459 [Sporobolomyces salmonicolor]|uniref:SPOSA6832_03459-mRNA-1:cds n=1 Tax=Sporidiobolus salmonicolor TaxID=5005 RepID=A0A0D6EP77_SPOSA|nr:SPOSA6832_03459 [Sporobolomyces salmonicolor]